MTDWLLIAAALLVVFGGAGIVGGAFAGYWLSGRRVQKTTEVVAGAFAVGTVAALTSAFVVGLGSGDSSSVGSSIQLGLQAGAFGFNFLAGMISTVVSYRLGLVDG